MKRGFFIGRFQPFHKGHLKCCEDALKEVDHLVIGIGSSQYSGVMENPFNAEDRAAMIEAALKEAGITEFTIFFVPDINNDVKWVEHVTHLVPEFHMLYTGNSHTAKLFKEKGYEVRKVDFIEGINGTSIRDMMARNENWQDLVPKAVLEYLNKIKGAKTLKKISKQ
ncbi:MAG: nicotinamide-nucleotide adenylyltransferase [Nanoarchaeota archaeon]|nr:nicotinamide-nucleotide adenylyltransferase [Nanoarchaeota archaeon]